MIDTPKIATDVQKCFTKIPPYLTRIQLIRLIQKSINNCNKLLNVYPFRPTKTIKLYASLKDDRHIGIEEYEGVIRELRGYTKVILLNKKGKLLVFGDLDRVYVFLVYLDFIHKSLDDFLRGLSKSIRTKSKKKPHPGTVKRVINKNKKHLLKAIENELRRLKR